MNWIRSMHLINIIYYHCFFYFVLNYYNMFIMTKHVCILQQDQHCVLYWTILDRYLFWCAYFNTWLPLPVLVGPSSMIDELPGANEAVASNVVSASRLLVCATFSMMIPGFMSLLSCGLLAAFAFLALRFNACNEHKT